MEANKTVADLVSFFVHFKPKISLNQRDRILIKKTVNEIAEKLGDRVSSVNRIFTDIVFFIWHEREHSYSKTLLLIVEYLVFI